MILPFRAAQRDALLHLRRTRAEVRVVLIGAGAIALHRPDFRPTSDLDLVLVAPLEEFPTLLGQAGWTAHPSILHRYRAADDVLFDVLPATEEVVQSGIVRFEDGVEMSSIGFDLVLAHAERISLDGEIELEIASLATLFVLKVVAWLERPFERSKDIDDIVYLLEHALGEDDDRRWDMAHPVGQSGLAFDEQSPYFMGLEAARVCAEPHRARVLDFLARVKDPESAPFGRMLRASRALGDDARYLSRMLASFGRAFG